MIIRTLGLFFCLFGICNAQLIPQEKIDTWRKAFPRIENDEEVQNAIKSDSVLFYTDAEMPRAYQFKGFVHDPEYNVAAVRQYDKNGKRLPGNGNKEFPWDKPGGTDFVNNLSTLRFIYLPKAVNDVKWPIVYWDSSVAGDPITEWIFPVGTIVGEFLAFYPPEGYYSYIFEIRVRKREIDKWEMDVFKPFQTYKELAVKLKELGRNDLAEQILNKPILQNYKLAENQVQQVVFRVEMPLDYLPEFGDKELVHKLLTESPFYSSAGIPWRWEETSGKTISNAPFTKEDFSIVPKDYLGGMVALTNESCTRCHKTALHHVNEFTLNNGNSREWYGRERGSDGIFSFHPFSHNSINHSGGNINKSINQKLYNTGFIAPYDPKVHISDKYMKLKEYSPQNGRFRGDNSVSAN